MLMSQNVTSRAADCWFSYFMVMAEPAHKKRKLSSSSLSGSDEESVPECKQKKGLVYPLSLWAHFCPDDTFGARQLLAEEFDLEIVLRKRLAATIESRVIWALVLQEVLSNNITCESASLLLLESFNKLWI